MHTHRTLITLSLLGAFALGSTAQTEVSRHGNKPKTQQKKTPAFVSTTACIGGVNYKTTSATTCTVMPSPDAKGHVAIPQSVNIKGRNYTVKTIGKKAFFENKAITSVSIPPSVFNIGERAFEYCSNITSISLPNSITSIEHYVFFGCDALQSINIPNKLQYIGAGAFAGLHLTSVTIPSTLKILPYEAFSYCGKLTDVVIPNSITAIEDRAFFGCNLSSINIPASTKSLDIRAIDDCDNLQRIDIDERNPHYCSVDGVLFNKNKTTLLFYPRGRKQSSYTIPSSVTTIGEYAFGNCEALTSVAIPSSVTTIGEYAFSACKALTSVAIPSSVKSVGKSAFKYCAPELKGHITYPAHLQSSYDSWFAW